MYSLNYSTTSATVLA